MTGTAHALATTAAVGAGLLAGVYTAFSTMVIPALRRQDPRDAAAVMIGINRVAERGPFLLLFGGAAVAAAALGVSALVRSDPADGAVAAASLASTAITVAVNVPLNRRLEREPGSWTSYARTWTAWNSICAVAAALAVVVAVDTRS
ncbi:hypothetical protein ASF48_14925 [Rathayibacter sp. Leaf299]|uniref:DUF1772 domain-containing protein n=1 Tax=Rathayibacter sp. Leaf299 TaxID=1736328 RepID=UPI0007007507|nr:DUF1772 domain-containing protein [Rathayibacter sp. Leaf299]KQQ19236.1 hypothetical protein ASF48_14925 [Rathayibacter sp. Leaf299]